MIVFSLPRPDARLCHLPRTEFLNPIQFRTASTGEGRQPERHVRWVRRNSSCQFAILKERIIGAADTIAVIATGTVIAAERPPFALVRDQTIADDDAAVGADELAARRVEDNAVAARRRPTLRALGHQRHSVRVRDRHRRRHCATAVTLALATDSANGMQSTGCSFSRERVRLSLNVHQWGRLRNLNALNRHVPICVYRAGRSGEGRGLA